MATSGSYNYTATAANIIQAALEDIGVIHAGETIDSDDQTLALQRLNFLAKQWQGNADMAQGLKVHTRKRVTLILASGQQTYVIGPGSSDARASTAVGRTTIDAAEASGQTVISVTATTDTTTYPGTTLTMTAADIIGIEQDDGTIHWSTIASVSAGDTVTIDDATTAAAAVGKYVWWFTSRAQRFPLCEVAVLRDKNLTDVPLQIYTDVRDYEMVADKYADGTPTAILIEPLLTQTRVTLNSQPDDVTDMIILTVLYPAEDYDATTDDVAFPQEWFAALEWELAKRLAPVFEKPWTQARESNWMMATSIARQLNPSETSVYFEPGRC